MAEEIKTKNNFDNVQPGMYIRVWQTVREGDKERVQPFEGLVIARKHGREDGATVTVRGILSGVGIEKIYPIYAPSVNKVEILEKRKVRRAKLYFVRTLPAKKARRKLKVS